MTYRIVFEPGWRQRVGDNVRGFLNVLGEDILADAAAACPVDTGVLRASLSHEVVDDTLRVGSVDVKYSVYVEEGTRYMAAEPYLRPALYRVRGR